MYISLLGIPVFVFGFPGRRGGGTFKPLFFVAGAGLFVLGFVLQAIAAMVGRARRARRARPPEPPHAHGPSR